MKMSRLLHTAALFLVGVLTLSMAAADVSAQVSEVRGVYRNTTEGFSIELPADWAGQEREGRAPLLVARSTVPDVTLLSQVYVFVRGDEASAADWLNVQRDNYGPDRILFSDPYAVEGAHSGSQSLFAVRRDSGVELFELWTVVARGSQFFLIRTQTFAELWPEVGPSANAFADSFTLETPMPFGASREDSLFQSWGEIVSIDPALARSSPADIVGALFSGLVKLDTNLEVVPDVAEGWDVSEGGTVFTFTLRSNARFHDGRPVTAADFKYSWERALDPAMESSTAKTFLGDIVGASEMLEGLAESASGIEAVDERTLRVTIDASRPAFLFKLAYPTAYVVDRANVEEGGADWTDAPNGTGAFKLKVWQKDELLVLERNDDWYGGAPALAHVVYRIYAGPPVQLYERREIDLTGIGISNIDRARDPSNPLNAHLREGTEFCTWYLGFNVTRPPFDDPNVRQAMALAMEVDREIEVTVQGFIERAAGIVPPGLPGHDPRRRPFAFDADAARLLLEQSSYGSAENLPPIVSHASDDAIHWAWSAHLGLEVESVSILEFSDKLDRLDNRELGVFVGGWCADYPDPENFLDVLFRSDSVQNHFAYSNPYVDSLLGEAAVEQDEVRRIALYQLAEQIILDDWVAIPLWHNREYVLVQPYVQGYELTPIGVPQLQNISIERTP